MFKFSLQGRFIFLLAAIMIATVLASVALAISWQSWALTVPFVVLTGLVAVIATVKAFFRPINETLQALNGGMDRFKDNDYSVTVATRRDDELGHLVSAYNELASTLRAERFGLFQRELLLDTVIQSSAVAVAIVNHNGVVVYSNREARQLLGSGSAIEGTRLSELCEQRSDQLAESVARRKDGLFTLQEDAESEVYHLTMREFNINAQNHGLYLFKRLTREIARKEVETWKKVIRLITHELNNSLAPISSLISSARTISETGNGGEKLDDIYEAIGNRASHLHAFIEQYARFARLPSPRIKNVEWQDFIGQLKRLVNFRLEGDLPDTPVRFDPVQMEQVLINLLKNASESGSADDKIQLRILQNREEALLAVEDRGSGMAAEQLQLAILPFFSTKRRGTGLGLPLCREIVEAHGGKFQLFNREGGGMTAVCKLPAIEPSD
jgi:nitrogen fixation/metabolism regulation signal transduction histidine kinase